MPFIANKNWVNLWRYKTKSY